MAGEVTNENEFVAVPFQAEISWNELKKDASGLVPCIVQDYKTGQVLMLAYMNEAAYLETAATGTMCYYSHSRRFLFLPSLFPFFRQGHRHCSCGFCRRENASMLWDVGKRDLPL